jgi:hypothetical protein
MEGSGQFHVLPVFSLGNSPRYTLGRKFGGSQSCSGSCVGQKDLCPYRESNPDSSVVRLVAEANKNSFAAIFLFKFNILDDLSRIDCRTVYTHHYCRSSRNELSLYIWTRLTWLNLQGRGPLCLLVRNVLQKYCVSVFCASVYMKYPRFWWRDSYFFV